MTRPNVTAYCRDRNIPYLRNRVLYALQGGLNRKPRSKANKKLLIKQELAFKRVCTAIDDVGFGITREFVRSAADALLADVHEGDSPPPHVGVNWASRWLNSHKEYYNTKAKPIDLAQKLAQCPEALLEWLRPCRMVKRRGVRSTPYKTVAFYF